MIKRKCTLGGRGGRGGGLEAFAQENVSIFDTYTAIGILRGKIWIIFEIIIHSLVRHYFSEIYS